MARMRMNPDGTWVDTAPPAYEPAPAEYTYSLGPGLHGRFTEWPGGPIRIVSPYDATYLFYQWKSLVKLPELDTSMATKISSAFDGCMSLTEVPLLDTSNATLTASMFGDCRSLTTIPPLDMTKVTNAVYMFDGCQNVENWPTSFNTPSLTLARDMFNSCYKLTVAPMMDLSKVTQTTNMFFWCSALTEIPAYDLNSVTSASNMNNMFYGCGSLTRAPLKNVRVSLSVANTAMGADALNELFTGLATVSGMTITITNTPGAATCDRTIAESKGWTVSG